MFRVEVTYFKKTAVLILTTIEILTCVILLFSLHKLVVTYGQMCNK
jgi:hypothetical protein